MKNFEKPLTWILAIVLIGYLFIANCDCGDTCPLNDGFTIEASVKNAPILESNKAEEVTVEVTIDNEDTTVIFETNIDSSEIVPDDVKEGGSE